MNIIYDKFSKNWSAIDKHRKQCKQCYNETYWKNKIMTDVDYKLKHALNGRIRACLINKSKRTLEYVGCDIVYLKQWLEHQFDENMNWENYGKYWHIDHVTPCSSFDFSDDKNIYTCYDWTNLRPCEAKENMQKHNKIIPELIRQHKELVDQFKLEYHIN
jgi:hypothetical protein